MASVPNPNADGKLPWRLNDRVGLWPAPAKDRVMPPAEWHRMPFLCLYLLLVEAPEVLSPEHKAIMLQWLQSVRAFGAGHCVVVVTLDSPTIAVAPGAAAAWKKAASQRAALIRELTSAHGARVVEMHPVLRPGMCCSCFF